LGETPKKREPSAGVGAREEEESFGKTVGPWQVCVYVLGRDEQPGRLLCRTRSGQ